MHLLNIFDIILKNGGDAVIKIALVDDESYFLDILYEKISNLMQDIFPEYYIQKFTSGNDFLLKYKSEPFNAVFLDIVMPDEDGFKVAEEICGISEQTYIIFVTTESMLVYDSFNFHPFDFIPKASPDILEKKLKTTVKRLSLRFAKEKRININLPHNKTMSAKMYDIMFLSSSGNNIKYYFKDRSFIEIRRKLLDAEADLDPTIFLRIHKSFIVNMSFIENINYHFLTIDLKDGTLIPISKTYKKETEKRYSEYLSKFGR